MDKDESTPEITRTHFKDAMKFAWRSITNNDIRKYEMFAQKLQMSRGFGQNFRWVYFSMCKSDNKNDLHVCHSNVSSLHRFPDAQPQGGAGGGAPPSGGDQLGDDGEDDLYS